MDEQRRQDYENAAEVANQEEEDEDEAGFIKVDDDEDEEGAAADEVGDVAMASDGVTITASPGKVDKTEEEPASIFTVAKTGNSSDQAADASDVIKQQSPRSTR